VDNSTELNILAGLFSLLKERFAIDFSLYKNATVYRRLQKRMNYHKIDSFEAYFNLVKTNDNEAYQLKNDLLIGVTEFFRDTEVFEYLEEHIMPNLCPNGSIRIWVSGCSTGEEAYSLGILLNQCFEKRGKIADFKIFATDVCPESIFIAGKGFYDHSKLENVNNDLLERYFIRTPKGYQVKKELREKIVFAHHNIIDDPPFIKMDLVSCRNLLIYLEPAVQQKILGHFYFSLNNDGIMLLGNSENTGKFKSHFHSVNAKWKIYRKVNGLSSFTNRVQLTAKSPKPKVQYQIKTDTETVKSKSKTMNETMLQNLLKEILPPLIIVDQHYNIVYTKGNAAGYLKIEEGLFHANLLKLLEKDSAIVLKTALDKVNVSQKRLKIEKLPLSEWNNKVTAELTLVPVTDKNGSTFIAILFGDTKAISDNDEIFAYSNIDEFSSKKIEEQEWLLQEKNNEVSLLTSELDDIKEKMQASNEELIASNEELQATNEELQSVNEELSSLNTEYQQSNVILTELNNDINNLLNSTEIATLFLDKELKIRKFTPLMKQHFHLHPDDIGRNFTSFASSFTEEVLREMATQMKQVLENGSCIEKEITNSQKNTFIRRISPFLTSNREIEGVVLTLIDITQQKSDQQIIKESEIRYKTLISSMPSAFALHEVIYDSSGVAVDYTFKEINSEFSKLTGLNAKDVIGKKATEVIKNLDKEWINIYGQIAQTRKSMSFVRYSDEINKHFHITAYSPNKADFATIFHDVSENIMNEQKMRESEEKYRLLVENSLVGVYKTNIHGDLLFANESFIKMLDYNSLEDFKKTTAWQWYQLQDSREKLLALLQIQGLVQNFETTFVTKQGNPVEVLISASLSGSVISGMIIDISEKVRSQSEVVKLKNRFLDTINNSLDGYMRTSLEGRIIEVNNAFCSMTGFSKNELMSMNYRDITPSTWILFEEGIIREEVFIKGYSRTYEKEYETKDGSHIPVELRTYLTRNEKGEPTEFWAFIRDISDRKQKEKLIQESAQRLELAISAAKQGLYDLNIVTGEAYVNDEYALMLGFDPQTFKETNNYWISRLHPDDVERTSIVFKNYIEGKTNEYRVEFRQKTAAGNYKWILSVGKIVEFSLDGSPLRMLGTHTDIDTIKTIQNKLAVSQERFALATAASNVGIWDWNVAENKVYYSSIWKAQVGYEPDELENKFESWEHLLHPDDYDKMHNELMRFMQSPGKYFDAEFRMRHKEGHYVWIFNRAAAIKDKNGNIVRMYGAHTDVTKRKEAELSLSALTTRLTLATQSAGIGIWEWNMHTNELLWDDRMYEMYGVKTVNNSDQKWLKALHPDDRERAAKELSIAIESSGEYKSRFHIIKPDGEVRCISAYAIILPTGMGNKKKLVGVNMDITNEEIARNQLMEAKEKAEIANIHKNNFLANMSHEIRTPMNGIIGFADLLKDETIEKNCKSLYLDIINRNSQSLLSLIDDIIDISRIEANELKIVKTTVNLSALFNELEMEFNHTIKNYRDKNIQFKFTIDASLRDIFIRTDDLRLRQVIVNLVNNSIKFTEKGIIQVNCSVKKKQLEFSVNDTGIGIPFDKTTAIFERFYRLDSKQHRKYSGTGLGLAISKGLISLLGGSIWVDNEYKGGASICFTIPYKIAVPKKTIKTLPETHTSESLLGLKALLVEDQENVYYFFNEVLKKQGAEVIWVESGEDAIEYYRQKQSEINLVLMDINLPGMDGIEATKKILMNDPSAIIIAQTAYATPDELEKCTSAGCVDYITKPIIPDALISKLKKYY
jgi:two-component system, chemotaxis family, CheB/CheR fusion protein